MSSKLGVIILLFGMALSVARAGDTISPSQLMQQKAYKARSEGHFDQALQYFRQAAAMTKNEAMKKYYLTEIAMTWKMQAFNLRNQGKYEAALAFLHKAEAFVDKVIQNKTLDLYFRLEIAQTWEVMGNMEKAKKAYFWAERYREIGGLLMREGKLQAALAVYRSIVKCYREKKDHYVKDAAKIFQDGGSVKCPNDGSLTGLAALDSIGMLHQRMGQLNLAESAYKEGLKKAQNASEVQIYQSLLGELYRQQNKHDSAFQAFRAAKKNLEVARTLTLMKEDPAAAQWYRSVIKQESEKIKDIVKNMENMKKFKLPGPNADNSGYSPEGSFHSVMSDSLTKMGDAYVGLKEPVQALKAYKKAYEYAVSYLKLSSNGGQNKFMVRKFQLMGFRGTLKALESKIAKLQGQ